MKFTKIFLTMLVISVIRCLVHADGLTNDVANPIKKFGDYSMTRGTNRYYTFVNPSEFWNGVWKEDTNGWRVQLRIYPMNQVETNLILRIEWGSAVKNSGDGYYMTPNGKYAKFELLDAKGNVVPPIPHAGINWMKLFLESQSSLISDFGIHQKNKLVYQDSLPSWVALTNGALVADFPKIVSTNVYPRIKTSTDIWTNYSDIVGKIDSTTNRPPFPYVGLFPLDYIYSITNEGDYTLTVQPVLYKRYNHSDDSILDRVDLPSVTTKVHLVRNVK
jgi:hypothetical protein